MTEKLPLKLDKISKRLWPKKAYLKIKETHPILGSIFAGLWSIFWTILAFLLNIAFLAIVVATILLILYAILDSGSANIDFYPSKKKKSEENY